jgi:hypothetical protein
MLIRLFKPPRSARSADRGGVYISNKFTFFRAEPGFSISNGGTGLRSRG